MGTTCSQLTTDLGYIIGVTIGASSRPTTTQAERLLNKGLIKLCLKLYDRRCWKVLRELQKTAEYTLTGATSYNVYTILGSSTDYLGYVSGRLAEWNLNEVSIEEEHKIQTSGEYDPKATDPYICFWGYDTAAGHGNLPVVLIRPSASTEILYFRHLIRPPTIKSAVTAVDSPLPSECDDALIFYAASMYWAGERNSEEWGRFRGMWNDEVDKLIAKYEEPLWKEIKYISV